MKKIPCPHCGGDLRIPAKYTADTIAQLEEQLQQVTEERDALRRAHPRAAKLMAKGKFFLVVAIDEPYFEDVYKLIRENENRKGTWLEEDEERFLEATRKEIEDA